MLEACAGDATLAHTKRLRLPRAVCLAVRARGNVCDTTPPEFAHDPGRVLHDSTRSSDW